MRLFARGLVVLAGAVAVGAPIASASAQSACTNCGPTVTTTYRYKTVYKVTNSTQYRDVTRVRYVKPAPSTRTTTDRHDRWFRDWRCPFTRR